MPTEDKDVKPPSPLSLEISSQVRDIVREEKAVTDYQFMIAMLALSAFLPPISALAGFWLGNRYYRRKYANEMRTHEQNLANNGPTAVSGMLGYAGERLEQPSVNVAEARAQSEEGYGREIDRGVVGGIHHGVGDRGLRVSQDAGSGGSAEEC